jgi:hypothetical protein
MSLLAVKFLGDDQKADLFYASWDWKESEKVLAFVADLSQSDPVSFRFVDLGDDCWHLVWGHHKFSLAIAERFVRKELGIE